jgi:protein N-terminal methyltransferase
LNEALGHISTPDLIELLKSSKKALRDEKSLIFVKENTCEDAPGGKGAEFLDEEDSSLTRCVHMRTRLESMS